MQVDATIERLQQVQSDAQTYAEDFRDFVDGDFPLIGHVNIQDTHEKVIVPYIENLLGNLQNRFGDAAGQISVASNIFNPSAVLTKEEEQLGKICALAKYFGVDKTHATAEWKLFRLTLAQDASKTSSEVMLKLINSDLSAAFGSLSHIAQVVATCPIGTAGKSVARYLFFTYLIADY